MLGGVGGDEQIFYIPIPTSLGGSQQRSIAWILRGARLKN